MTPKERAANHYARMRQAGFVKVALWVHKDDEERIRFTAQSALESHEKNVYKGAQVSSQKTEIKAIGYCKNLNLLLAEIEAEAPGRLRARQRLMDVVGQRLFNSHFANCEKWQYASEGKEESLAAEAMLKSARDLMAWIAA